MKILHYKNGVNNDDKTIHILFMCTNEYIIYYEILCINQSLTECKNIAKCEHEKYRHDMDEEDVDASYTFFICDIPYDKLDIINTEISNIPRKSERLIILNSEDKDLPCLGEDKYLYQLINIDMNDQHIIHIV